MKFILSQQYLMIKYLQTYCDINELVPIEGFVSIGEIIHQKKYAKVITRHVYGYVFAYFDALVRGEIDEATFMQMGDTYGTIDVYAYKNNNQPSLESVVDLQNSLEQDPEAYRDSLLVVDQVSYDFFVAHH